MIEINIKICPKKKLKKKKILEKYTDTIYLKKTTKENNT